MQMNTDDQDPNNRYMMHFLNFRDEKKVALVEGNDIVEASEIGEQEYAEDMAQMTLIETEQSFIRKKQEKAREFAAKREARKAKFGDPTSISPL